MLLKDRLSRIDFRDCAPSPQIKIVSNSAWLEFLKQYSLNSLWIELPLSKPSTTETHLLSI